MRWINIQKSGFEDCGRRRRVQSMVQRRLIWDGKKRFSHGKPETRCFCAAVSVHRGKQRCGDIYRFAHFFHHHIVPTFIPLATTRPPRELGLTLSYDVMATEFQKIVLRWSSFFKPRRLPFLGCFFRHFLLGHSHLHHHRNLLLQDHHRNDAGKQRVVKEGCS